MIRDHREAVEYDLIRSGLRLDWLGTEALSWRDLRVMVTQAQPDTAVFKSMNPHWQQTVEADLLRAIEFNVRILAWQQSRDGQKGQNKPEAWTWPWESKPDKAFRGDPMTIEEARDWLGWSQQMKEPDPQHDSHEAFPDERG